MLSSSYLIGLIGAGIQASRSPALHEREADELGLRYIYRLIDLDRQGLGVESLDSLLTAAERMRFDGLNVTHPCKQAVIPLLTVMSDEAAAIGAVNTIVLQDGKRIGHNTDASGFAASAREGLRGASFERVVLLGAGGAGAAVGHALRSLGARKITIFDLDPERAEKLARRLAARVGHDLEAEMAAADGLIHATPTGMTSHPGLPLREHLLRSELWVAEVVYFPLETELLRAAKRHGCRTLDGGGMAVGQAVDAFRLFTGREPDAARMRRHFESMVSK